MATQPDDAGDAGDPFVGDLYRESNLSVWRPHFLFSEANRKRSRGAGIVSVPVREGTVLQASPDAASYVPLVEAGAACAIALYPSAAAGEGIALVVRDAEVTGLLLVWPPDITLTSKATATAALAAVGIIVR
jgi:hypothetical protein